MTELYTLALDDPLASLDVVGGKGASLARLARWGLPVPDGFHVTTDAYRRFVADNDLGPAILDAVGATDPTRPSTLDATSGVIADLFVGATVPTGIAEAIAASYQRLPQRTAVAVRSSATAEDLPGMSFAGQQETFLNVRGTDAVLRAVTRCWASLWTARAIAYRLRLKVDQESISMGVAIQTMLRSDVAGVLLTADPSTGQRERIVVSSSYGLGEGVVSGLVTPDTFVVDRASRTITTVTLGTKQTAVHAAPEQGTVTESVSDERRARQALARRELEQLVELALRVEAESAGEPQDIEWAVAAGRCWLLQARPMTGLPPAASTDVRWEPPVPGTKWIRRQVAENMPEPLSPLFDELYLGDGMKLAMTIDMELLGYAGAIADTGLPPFATVNGYAYLCASTAINWRGLPRSLVAFVGGRPMRAAFVRAIPNWEGNDLPRHLETIERWKRLEPARAPDATLLDGIRDLVRSEAVYWASTSLVLAAAKNSDALLNRFLSIAMPRSGLGSAVFLRGFASKARQAESELAAIAEQVRASDTAILLVRSTPGPRLLAALTDDPAGQVFADSLRDYLERYGHQVYNLDFADPTQIEDPTPVLLSLKAAVDRPAGTGPVRQAQLARDRELLVEQTARALDPVRRRLFLKIVRWAQSFAPFREEALFSIGSAWPTLRRLALELGRRLADAGTLEDPDDVFYLDTEELLAAIRARASDQAEPDLVQLARERRELRKARRRLHPPAAVPAAARWKFGPFDLSDFETQKRNVDKGPILRGFPVSPGRVTAPVSVILSPEDFDAMVQGTVLVCPTTVPAWTPLFAQASALVTDIGGVAAHGSIVAREYGIPAVMGTGNATEQLVSGQRVTVDGDAGTVTWTP